MNNDTIFGWDPGTDTATSIVFVRVDPATRTLTFVSDACLPIPSAEWGEDYATKLQRSWDALADAVERGRADHPPPELEARHGFQDAPRRPCYRAPRVR